jgi:hypothetical protein
MCPSTDGDHVYVAAADASRPMCRHRIGRRKPELGRHVRREIFGSPRRVMRSQQLVGEVCAAPARLARHRQQAQSERL